MVASVRSRKLAMPNIDGLAAVMKGAWAAAATLEIRCNKAMSCGWRPKL